MANLTALTKTNAARWAAMHVVAAQQKEVNTVAVRLVAAKARYATVSLKTGVPWFVIAVIHEREASQNWNDSIAQGDPWDKVSIHVPKGRGPFASWEAAAIDALTNCAPYAARWKDWTAGGALTLLEQYNGLGYADGPFDRYTGEHYPPQPSPYIWAGTDQYHIGKYTADGSFDPSAVDQQLGCAALIAGMRLIDSSVAFSGATVLPSPPPPPVIPPKPAPVAAPASLWSQITTIISKQFGKSS